MFKFFKRNGFVYTISSFFSTYRFSFLPLFEFSFLMDGFKIEVGIFSLFFEFSKMRYIDDETIKKSIDVLKDLLSSSENGFAKLREGEAKET